MFLKRKLGINFSPSETWNCSVNNEEILHNNLKNEMDPIYRFTKIQAMIFYFELQNILFYKTYAFKIDSRFVTVSFFLQTFGYLLNLAK